MKVLDESLGGVRLLEPTIHYDKRGFFMESYNQAVLDGLGIAFKPVQDNHSMSTKTCTLRGLHFQIPPYVQAKLVRVLAGAIYDVVIDVRSRSSMFGQWKAYNLSAENRHFLFVPKGFAHGFCTLVDNTEVFYKVDNLYSQRHSAGILWSDPSLDIKWPPGSKVVSEQDSKLPTLTEWIKQGS